MYYPLCMCKLRGVGVVVVDVELFLRSLWHTYSYMEVPLLFLLPIKL